MLTFQQPIREYISYTESVKEALMRRDNVQIQYESAVDEIYRKKNDQVILVRIFFSFNWQKKCSKPEFSSIQTRNILEARFFYSFEKLSTGTPLHKKKGTRDQVSI